VHDAHHSFLKQNMTVLESFKMSSTVRIGSDGKKTAQPVLTSHWYDPRTRFEICGALKWTDGLFEVFRKEIVAEDRSVLLPKLHVMDQQRELMVEKDRAEVAKVYSNSAADQTARKNYATTSELQWAAFDKQYETIKTSNSKRNDLLLATNFPTLLFEEISFPASIIAVTYPSFETEEVVIEALRQILQRISDTISCNYQKLLNEIRAKSKVPKADNHSPLDGVLCMNEQYLRFFAVGKHPVQMTPKVEEDDGEFDPTTKYAYLADFPPNIQTVLPGGISVSLTAESKQVSEKDQNGVYNDRTKLLDDLTPAEFHVWMQGFLSHIPLLMEIIPEAAKEYDAYVPIAQRQLAQLPQLTYKETDEDKRLRNKLKKEVEYRLKRVEAQEIWPRDRAFLILRRMRRDTNRWLASPSGRTHAESAEIGQLHAQIDAFEDQLKEIRPYKAVEFGWVFAPCPRVNKAGGCADRQEGLCLFTHWNEGKTCDSVMKSIACEFGGGCVKLHVAPSDQSSRPQTAMSGRSFDTSSSSFPGTPTSSTYPCPHVNKPGGCADESKCTFNHRNSGRICQNFRDSGRCNRGGNCAFIHPGEDDATSSVSRRTDKNTDLRPILDQVLSDPRKYWVCSYVNKGVVGCFKEKNPGRCPFNHTLSGVQCPDDNGEGGCHRRLLCPLRHSPVSFRGSQSGKRRADDSPADEAAPEKRPRLAGLSSIPSMEALSRSQQRNSRSSSPSSHFLTSDSAQYGTFRPQGRPQAQHFRQQQTSQSTGHNPFYPKVTPHFSQGYQQQLPQSPTLDPLHQDGAPQSAGRPAYDQQQKVQPPVNAPKAPRDRHQQTLRPPRNNPFYPNGTPQSPGDAHGQRQTTRPPTNAPQAQHNAGRQHDQFARVPQQQQCRQAPSHVPMEPHGPAAEPYQLPRGPDQFQHVQPQQGQAPFQLQQAPNGGGQTRKSLSPALNGQPGGFRFKGAAIRVPHGPSSDGQQGQQHNNELRNDQPRNNQQGPGFIGRYPLHRAYEEIASSPQQPPNRLGNPILQHEPRAGRKQKRSRSDGDVDMLDADAQPQKRPKKIGRGGRGGKG
jgi:hypothetical protein